MIHLHLPHSWLHFPIRPLPAPSLILVQFPFLLPQPLPSLESSKVRVPCGRLPAPSVLLHGKLLSCFSLKSLGTALASGREGSSTPFKEPLRNSAMVKLPVTIPPAMVAAGDGKTRMRNTSASPRSHILSGSKSQAASMPNLHSPG